MSSLLNYIDIETLKEVLNAFTTTTNLMANIVDVDGISIFSHKDSNSSKLCRFCRIIYGTKNGAERCRNAYKRAGAQTALLGKPYIFRCPAGLIEWASPIIVDDEHLGTIICGQVLMWKPEEFFWIELREMNRDLELDFTELFRAVEELPIVSGHQVQAAAYLLYVVANYITKAGWKNYNQSKQIEHQQTLIHAKMEKRKNSKNQLEDERHNKVNWDENEILSMIYLDGEESRDCFQSFLIDLVFNTKENLCILQYKMIELLTIISRVAVKLGVDEKISAEFNRNCISEIYKANAVEIICIIMKEAFQNYYALVGQKKDDISNFSVKGMMHFIKCNYSKNITIHDISESVYLSASYACRIFKKKTGVSIMSYLEQVRIEKARVLLESHNYQIEEIAKKLGFSDSSYFTKVFKKIVNITPTQYRKRNS